MHAVQVLPALALLLRLSDFSERRRLWTVVLEAAGYAGLIASTFVQTYAGEAPLDVGVGPSVVALAGLALLGASGGIALQGLQSSGVARRS